MSILCVGEMVADIVVKPVPDLSNLPDSTLVDQIALMCGGDALNTAIGLGRTKHSVYFIGKAGKDFFARRIVDIASEAGVCMDYVQYSADRESSKVVALVRGDGARNFLHAPGSNEEFCPGDISEEAMRRCSHLHIGGTFHLPAFDGVGAASVLKKARENGLTTSMDVAYDHSGRWLETIQCCMPHLDYFLPSLGEARCMFPHLTAPSDIAARLKDLGVRNVVIKMGEEGVYCSPEKGEPFTCGCYHVKTVDTTGAGDAFVGGFIGALDDGESFETSVVRGTATAAFAVQAVGATAGIPDQEELLSFINSTERLEIKRE